MFGEQCSCAGSQRCDDRHWGLEKQMLGTYRDGLHDISHTLKDWGLFIIHNLHFCNKIITIVYGFTDRTLCSGYKQFIRKLCNFNRLE